MREREELQVDLEDRIHDSKEKIARSEELLERLKQIFRSSR
jgi:hypothetical protein